MMMPSTEMTPIDLKLTLGPVLFFWSRDDILRFYSEAADWPLDSVYLGEVVCSRRQQMRPQDWISLAGDLAASGREVVLSCQALIESESDLKRLRKLVDNGQVKVEANDLGAVKLARERKLPFVAGPHLNIYNAETLQLMQSLGCCRWLPPVEITRVMLAGVLAAARARGVKVETELFAWGKLPLALSARCFTARHYNLNKDDCQFRCLEHPDGLTLATREGQDFLCINGIQTMSQGCHSLLQHLAEARACGVDSVRVSPQSQGTAQVVSAFRQVLDGRAAATDLLPSLQTAASGQLVDGYWRSLAGIAQTGELSHACS